VRDAIKISHSYTETANIAKSAQRKIRKNIILNTVTNTTNNI